MEFKRIVIPVKNVKDWINIHPISDSHIGNACHNAHALNERIKQIKKDPNAIWFTVGDLADLILYTDPRYHVMALDANITIDDFRDAIMKAVRKIVDKFEPIKDKCLGVMTGNHEEKASQKYHVDATKQIAERLNVNYLGYSCLMFLAFTGNAGKSHSVTIYANHGHGGGKRHGSQINKVEDALRVADADIYVMGHVHGKAASQLKIKGITKTGRPTKKLKTFIITSSYMESSVPGSISFAERMMMPEAPLGSPVIKVNFSDKFHELRVKVEV